MPPPFLIRRLVVTLIAASLLGAFGLGTAAPVASAAPARIAPAPAPADVDRGGPRWTELSASQRRVLAPLANDWNDGIDSRSKERWMDVASRFHKMPAEQQQRATQRMVAWSHMTVAQRMQARENFQELRSVSKEEREARWKAYQALPEEKKRELAKRAATPASGASMPVAVRHRPPPPLTAIQPKTAPGSALARAPAGSAPVSAQARPGATTALINRRPHVHESASHVALGPTAVDRTTLLPRHASQPTAAALAASPASPAHR